MKVSPHFLRLYIKTLRRYKKLSRRLNKQLSAGQFQQQSDYARKQFLFEIEKLKKKLLGFRTQFKLATAAGITALVLSSGSASAQQMGPFAKQSRGKNPFPESF